MTRSCKIRTWSHFLLLVVMVINGIAMQIVSAVWMSEKDIDAIYLLSWADGEKFFQSLYHLPRLFSVTEKLHQVAVKWLYVLYLILDKNGYYSVIQKLLMLETSVFESVSEKKYWL